MALVVVGGIVIDPVARDYLACVASIAQRYEDASARWSELRTKLDRVPAAKRDAKWRRLDSEIEGQIRTKLDAVFEDTRIALPLIRKARLFHFSDEVYRAATKRAMSGELVGVPDLSALPFDVCWFGSASADVLDLLDPMGPNHGLSKAILAGVRPGLPLVLTRSGVFFALTVDAGGWSIAGCAAVDEEGTDATAVHVLWACSLLVDVAVARGEVSRPTGLAVSRLLDRAGKHGARPTPPTLYTVRMDARRAGHAIGAVVAARSGPGYRFEVRGHPRLLVRRGPWPDPDTIALWEARDYVVKRGDDVSPAWRLEMDLRGVEPPTAREWVALKIVVVKEHEKGPEGPVVPAIRVGG